MPNGLHAKRQKHSRIVAAVLTAHREQEVLVDAAAELARTKLKVNTFPTRRGYTCGRYEAQGRAAAHRHAAAKVKRGEAEGVETVGKSGTSSAQLSFQVHARASLDAGLTSADDAAPAARLFLTSASAHVS